MTLGIILLIAILVLLFRDVIIKMFSGKKIKKLPGNKVITEEYESKQINNKQIYLDVLDTEVKVLFDNKIDTIKVITSYLSEEFIYEVTDKDEILKVIKNNKNNFKNLGSSGKVLVKIPNTATINKLNVTNSNGDIEIYDCKIDSVSLKCESGLLKVETLDSVNTDIFKKYGDVSLNNVNVNSLKVHIDEGNADFSDVYGKDINIECLNGDFVFANVNKDYVIENFNAEILNGKKNIDIKFIE